MGQETDLKKMKVPDLKLELEKRGKPTEGLKAELVNRLQALLDEEEFNLADDAAASTAPAAATTTVVTKTPETSFLVPNSAAVVPAVEGHVKPPIIAEEASTITRSDPSIGDESGNIETSGAVNKSGIDVSFEEKKRLRAQRFSIPIVETKEQPTTKSTDTSQGTKGGNSKRQKTDPPGAKKGESIDTGTAELEVPVLLSKDEIEKQLKRADKYGGVNQGRIDELKAMLRKHRFASSS